MDNFKLHSLILYQGEVLDLSVLCLIPTLVSVQEDNYVSHYLDISAAYEIVVGSSFMFNVYQ